MEQRVGRCSLSTLLRVALLCAAWEATRALPPPQLDYEQYLPDYSYLQRDHPCSDEERTCFSYGRLLHAADGKCYRVGERGPCAQDEIFHANKTEAQRDGGRFQGVCSRMCKDQFHVRLAATGQCVSRADHENTVCSERQRLRASLSAFGEGECECEGQPCVKEPPPRPVHPYAGRCAAPDVRRPTPGPLYRSHLQGVLPPCTAEQHACLQRGMVLVDDECHALRTRGPCASAEWLVLDAGAIYGMALVAFSPGGSIRPVCKPRPCSAGSVALASDRRCHPLAELRTKLCAGEHVLYDVLGFVGCTRQLPQTSELPTKRTADGRCVMESGGAQLASTGQVVGVQCAQGDGGACAQTVKVTPPPFVLRPEDD